MKKWYAFFKNKKTAMMVAAILVVFVTTYSLILPALTVEASSAAEAGIILDQEAADNAKTAGIVSADPSADTSADSSAADSQTDGTDSTAVSAPAANDNGTYVAAETEEPNADAIEMPAQTFEAELKEEKITVYASAEEGAFPEGTEMKAEAVSDEENINKITEAAEKEIGDKMQIRDIEAIDITFWLDDAEIEPEQPIDVTIASEQLADEEETEAPLIIHINDEDSDKVADVDKGKAEVIIPMTEKELEKKDIKLAEDEIAFTAGQFSVYAIVYPEAVADDADETAQSTEEADAAKAGETEEADANSSTQPEAITETDGQTDAADSSAAVEAEPADDAVDAYSYEMVGGTEVSLKKVLKDLGIKNMLTVNRYVTKDISRIDTAEDSAISITKTDRDYTIGLPVKEGEDLRGETADFTIVQTDGEQLQIGVTVSGKPEIDLGTAVISAADNSYLPEDASGHADVVDGAKSIKKVQNYTDNKEEQGIVKYTVFDIGVDNVAESSYKEGFDVQVNLPETIAGKDFHLYHIHGGTVEELDIDINATETTQAGEAEISGFHFTTDGFSEFVLSYTVDFEYVVDGQKYAFSMAGGDSIDVGELLEKIGVCDAANRDAFVAEIATVEFSDPELVEVVHTTPVLGIGKESWTLKSLAPFTSEETLTITMKDGQVFEIKVTDAQVTTSTNLRDFLAEGGLSISGATQKADGTWEVKKGQPYTVSLVFAEIAEQLQLDMDATNPKNLTYALPSGFTPTGLSGVIPGTGFNLNYTIKDGVVTFTWDITNPDLFQKTVEAQDTEIRFNLTGVFDSSQDDMKWSDDVTIKVDVDDKANVTVGKTGSFNAQDGKMHYTVTVVSDGVNENVTVKDVINATGALSYNGDVSFPDGKGITANTSGNGFEATIPKMMDGETISFTYTADVNYSILEKGDNGKYGSVEQTGNTVTVNSDQDKTPDDNTKEFSLDHEIQFSSGGKNVEAGELKDGKRTLIWHISVNPQKLVALNGKPITDRIANDPKHLMHYSGEGLTITKYSKAGGEGETTTVKWSDIGVNTSSATSWTWTPTDTDPYQYEITYTTEVDVSDQIVDYSVKNDFSYEYGEASTTGIAKPDENRRVGLEKNVSSINRSDEGMFVTWTIDIDVPPNGLDKAEVVEKLPTAGGVPGMSGKRSAYDTLVSYSVSDPAGEKGTIYDYNYEETITTVTIHDDATNTDSQESFKTGFTLNFKKKDASGQWVDGIAGTGTQRTITVTVVSQMDPEWVQAAIDTNNVQRHTNGVELDYGGEAKLTDSAEAVHNPTPPSISKAISSEKPSGNVTLLDGVTSMPYWYYTIDISGITEDAFDEDGNLVITDTFDSTYLTLYENGINANGVSNPQNTNVLWADKNGYGNWVADTTNRVAYETTPGTISITLNKNSMARPNSTEYYQRYRVEYALFVKDKDALDALKEAAAFEEKSIKELNNTVTWGDLSDEATAKYEQPVVTKDVTDSGRNEKTGTYDVSYQVLINPDGYKLGNDKYITVTDTIENLAVDYTSISWEPADAVVNMTRDQSTITYRMKNETPITLTYVCSVRESGDYKNTITVHGQAVEKEGSADLSAGGSVSSGDYKIVILKHDGENMQTVLRGVEFDLYKKSSTDSDWVFLETLETDNKGQIAIDTVPDVQGDDPTKRVDLIPDTVQYKLVEHVENAAQGVGFTTEDGASYQPLGYDVLFTIGKNKAPTYSAPEWIYMNNESVGVANYPVEEESLDITVKKLWGSTREGEELPTVTLHLYKKADQYSEEKELVQDITLPITEDDEKVWQKTITGLDKNYAYVIEEEPIEGYVAVYSANNELGLKHSGTLSVTNSLVDIDVSKVWQNDDGTTITDDAILSKLPDVTVHLYKDGKIVPGKDLTLTANGGFEGSWTGLEPANYTVVEESAGDQISVKYTTSSGASVTSLSEPGTVVLTNRVHPVTVKKIWKNAAGDITTTAGAESISVTLLKNGTPVSTKELNSASNWEATWYDLDTSGKYTFSEANVNGYEVESIVYKDSEGGQYYYGYYAPWSAYYYLDENGYPVNDQTNGKVAYKEAQPNGTIEITNKPVEENPEKTQVVVNKLWYDGETAMSASDVADKSATIKLVRYKTEVAGTIIHFMDAQGGTFGIKVAAKNSQVTATIQITDQNYSDLVVSSISAFDYNTMRNGTVDSVDYMLAKYKPTNDANFAGKSSPYDVSVTFNTGNYSDLYVVYDEWPSYNNGYSHINGEVSVSPEAEAGTPVLDTAYSQTITLKAPDFSGQFYNLDTTGTEGGKNYTYTYAVVEENPETGFTAEYKVGNEDYKETLTAADAVGDTCTNTITVKNTTTNTDDTSVTARKTWITADGSAPTASVKLALYKNGTKVTTDELTTWGSTVTDNPVTVAGNNSATWDNLPKSDDITYTVKEEAIVVNGGEISAADWATQYGTYVKGADGKYTEGKEATVVNGVAEITNAEKTRIDFEKKWEGTYYKSYNENTPEEKTQYGTPDNTHNTRSVIQLVRSYTKNGTKVEENVGNEVQLGYDYISGSGFTKGTFTTNDWQGSFENLDKVGVVDGQLVTYEYSVKETKVYLRSSVDPTKPDLLGMGLYTQTSETKDGKTTITNTFVTTDLQIEKTWQQTTVDPSKTTVKVQLKRARKVVYGAETDSLKTVTEAGAVNYGEPVEVTYNSTTKKWEYSVQDLPKYGCVTVEGHAVYYEYEYFVEEAEVKIDGVDVTSQFEPVITSTEEDGVLSISIVNRKPYESTEVTVNKYWDDSMDGYTWEAVFALEYAERLISENGEDVSAAHANDVLEFKSWKGSALETEFGEVKDVKLTNESPKHDVTFKTTSGGTTTDVTKTAYYGKYAEKLPKYRTVTTGEGDDAVTRVYELTYSVTEPDVKVYKDGKLVDKTFFCEVLDDADGTNNYAVVAHNVEATPVEVPINVSLKKTWDGKTATDDSYSATFELHRYMHREYTEKRDVSTEGKDVTVTLMLNGNKASELTVKEGTSLSISATIAPERQGQITFTKDSGGTVIGNITYNREKQNVLIPIGKVTSDLTVSLSDTSWFADGEYGAHLSTAYQVTQAAEDASFSEEFTLSGSAWEWSKNNLPLISTVETPDTIVTTIYGYYFVEKAATPEGYSATYTDGNGNKLGDENNRIYTDNQTVVADNVKDRLRVEKVWYHLVADRMPPAVFKLYQVSLADGQKSEVTNVTAYTDSGAAVSYGTYAGHSGYKLEKGKWVLNFNTADLDFEKYKYYVEEEGVILSDTQFLTTAELEASGWYNRHYLATTNNQLPYSAETSGKFETIVPADTNAANQTLQSSGTLGIYNSPRTGYQIALEKKWYPWENGGQATDLEYDKAYATIQIEQTAYDLSGTEKVGNPATVNFGQPITIIYNKDGSITVDGNPVTYNDPNGYVISQGSQWKYNFTEDNFPAVGYVDNGDGTYTAVAYGYSVKETEVVDTLGRTWVLAHLPESKTSVQRTLYNFESGELILHKYWDVNSNDDKKNVYLTLTCSSDTNYSIDGTTANDDVVKYIIEKGYESDFGLDKADFRAAKVTIGGQEYYCIVISGDKTKSTWTHTLKNLDMFKMNMARTQGSGEVTYTVTEVGTGDSDTSITPAADDGFRTTYDRKNRDNDWNLNNGGSGIQLNSSRNGATSEFRVNNVNTPTTEITLYKKWGSANASTPPTDGTKAVFEIQKRVQKLKLKDGGVESNVDDYVDDGWNEWGSTGYTFTLPKEKPADSSLSDAEWLASDAAWTYTWDDLPVTERISATSGDAEIRGQVEYRIVETSYPGWVNPKTGEYLAVEGAAELLTAEKDATGSVPTYSQTITNEDKTSDKIKVTKKWTDASGAEIEWPAGYEAAYKIVRHAYLVNTTEKNGEVTYSVTKKEVGDAVTVYPASGQSAEKLTAEKKEVEITFDTALPQGGTWTATADDETLGVTNGTTYLVKYVYEVVEDDANSVKPSGSSYTFTGVAKVDETKTTPEANLTNVLDTTELVVEKKWTKNGEAITGDWPSENADQYKIQYKVEQSIILTGAEPGTTRDAVVNSGIVVFTSDDSTALTSTNKTHTISGLLKTGKWTAPSTITLANVGAWGVEAGKTYSVRYEYKVVEQTTSSKPADSNFVYSEVEAEAEVNETTGNFEATLVNDFTDIKVVKEWKTIDASGKNIIAADWPEGYQIGYRIIRTSTLLGTNTVVAQEDYYKSVDNGSNLVSSKQYHELKNLPLRGELVLTERDEVHDLDPGTYTVLYTYSVVEGTTTDEGTGIIKDGTLTDAGDAAPLAVEAVVGEDGTTYTITNKLTQVEVRKIWTGDGHDSDDDYVTVQLYRSIVPPEGSITVTVKVDEWIDNTAAPTGANSKIEGTIHGYNSQGYSKDYSVTLNPANGWETVKTGLPLKDANGNLISYSFVSGSTQDAYNVSIKDGSPVTGGSGTIALKAKGVEKPQYRDVKIHMDWNGTFAEGEPVTVIFHSDTAGDQSVKFAYNESDKTIQLYKRLNGQDVNNYTISEYQFDSEKITSVTYKNNSGVTNDINNGATINLEAKAKTSSNLNQVPGKFRMIIDADVLSTQYTIKWDNLKINNDSQNPNGNNYNTTTSAKIQLSQNDSEKEIWADIPTSGGDGYLWVQPYIDVQGGASVEVVVNPTPQKPDPLVVNAHGQTTLMFTKAQYEQGITIIIRPTSTSKAPRKNLLKAAVSPTNLIFTDSYSLPADAEAVGSEVRLNNNSDWSNLWENLPLTDENGSTIYYYVKETGVHLGNSEYEQNNVSYSYEYYSGENQTNGIQLVTVTNETIKKNPDYTTVTATKTWGGGSWPTGLSVEMELVDSAGNHVNTSDNPYVLTASTPTHTWTKLDKNQSYQVRENKLLNYGNEVSNFSANATTGYKTTITVGNDGKLYTIDNAPQTTSVKVTKEWLDSNGETKDIAVGTEIKFRLYQVINETANLYVEDGKSEAAEYSIRYVRTEEGGSYVNKWETKEFTNLPKYIISQNQLVPVTYYAQEVTQDDVHITYKLNSGNESITASDAKTATAGDTITIVNKDIDTDINILKVIDNKTTQTLKNVKFQLFKVTTSVESGEEVETETKIGEGNTNSLGKLSFKNLTVGKYRIKEVEAPDGYKKLTGDINFTVTETDGVVSVIFTDTDNVKYTAADKTFTVNNQKLAELNILKKDENDSALEGAGFTLYKAVARTETNGEGQEVTTYTKGSVVGLEQTTDEDGAAIFENLDEGKYILEETTAPDGYIKMNPIRINVGKVGDELKVTVDENTNGELVTFTDATATLNITDRKDKGQITIIKEWSENDHAAFSGVAFKLWGSGTNFTDDVFTSANLAQYGLTNATYDATNKVIKVSTTSTGGGQVVITGLPTVNAAGNTIEYNIVEVGYYNQAGSYVNGIADFNVEYSVSVNEGATYDTPSSSDGEHKAEIWQKDATFKAKNDVKTTSLTLQKRWYWWEHDAEGVASDHWDINYGSQRGDIKEVYFNLYRDGVLYGENPHVIKYGDSIAVDKEFKETLGTTQQPQTGLTEQQEYEQSLKHWTLTISDLPAGYTYTVVECFADGSEGVEHPAPMDCYEFGQTVFAMKNILVDIKAAKTWADADTMNAHPDLTFHLYRQAGEDGEKELVDSQTVNADSSWQHEWTKLPRYVADASGKITKTMYIYTVEEDAVPGYTDAASGAYTENHTNTPETTDVKVDKKWSGMGEDSTWPEGYTVTYDVVQHIQLITKSTDSKGNVTYNTVDSGKTGTGLIGRTLTNAEEVTHAGLVKVDWWTPDAEFIAPSLTGGTSYVKNGDDYFVNYTYEVVETGVYDGDATGTNLLNKYVVAYDTETTAGKTSITNTPNTTEFEFGKVWKDISGGETTWVVGAEIEVTLGRRNATSKDIETSYSYTYKIKKTETGFDITPVSGAPTMTPLTGDGDKFKLADLEKYKLSNSGDIEFEWEYFVTETQVSGYNAPSYATRDNSGNLNTVVTGDDVNRALNKQLIVNTPEGGFELPSTGGPGTTLFTIIGSILMVFAGGVLLFRRRRLAYGTNNSTQNRRW